MKIFLFIFLLLSISNSIKIEKIENENILINPNTSKCFSINYYSVNDKHCNLDIFWNLEAYCSNSCIQLTPDVLSIVTGIKEMDYSLIVHCNGTIDIYKGQYCAIILNSLEVSLPHCFPNKQNQNSLKISLAECSEKEDIYNNFKINLITFLILTTIIIYIGYTYFSLFFRKNKCKYFFKNFFLKKLNTN